MSTYRRLRAPGASCFFTLCLAQRGGDVLVRRIDLLRRACAETFREAPVFCDAMVVLPDHLHAVWTLPPGDAAYSERWRRIKARFTHALGEEVGRIAHPTASQRRKRERGVWQRRFWEHTIRDAEDYRAHVEYCWGNPVRHGLVARAAEWPYSSIHRDIRAGRVSADWAGAGPEGEFGEPQEERSVRHAWTGA